VVQKSLLFLQTFHLLHNRVYGVCPKDSFGVELGLKSFLENRYIVLAARIVLGFIFVVASIDKIADPNAFAVSVGYYKLVGSSLSLFIATVLPWVELLCGLGLIFSVKLRGSSLLVLLMLVIFTAGVISGIVRGLDISCGCFTSDPTVDKIGWMKVMENCGLILLSIVVLFSKSVRFSIDRLHNESTKEISNDAKDSLS